MNRRAVKGFYGFYEVKAKTVCGYEWRYVNG